MSNDFNVGDDLSCYETLQSMMDAAGKHSLQMECLMSLINNIADDDLDLEQECAKALSEWDV